MGRVILRAAPCVAALSSLTLLFPPHMSADGAPFGGSAPAAGAAPPPVGASAPLDPSVAPSGLDQDNCLGSGTSFHIVADPRLDKLLRASLDRAEYLEHDEMVAAYSIFLLNRRLAKRDEKLKKLKRALSIPRWKGD